MDAEAAEEKSSDMETLVADLKGLLVLLPPRGAERSSEVAMSDGGLVMGAGMGMMGSGKGSSTDPAAAITFATAAGARGEGLHSRPRLPPSPSSSSPSSSLAETSDNANTNASGNDSSNAENNGNASGNSNANTADVTKGDRSNISAERKWGLNHGGVGVAGRRILSLSEELRSAKLEASGLRRHVSGLREDRRHLERKLAAAEVTARALEEAKAEMETRALLAIGHAHGAVEGIDSAGGHDGGSGDGGGGDGGGGGDRLESAGRAAKEDRDGGGVARRREGWGLVGGYLGRGGGGAEEGRSRGEGGDGGLSEEEQRLLAVAVVMPAEVVGFGGFDPEEALQRLQDANVKVRASSIACLPVGWSIDRLVSWLFSCLAR